MTENTEEAVALRSRGKNLMWEYTTLDAPLISVVATGRQPLFPLSSLQTRDARIEKLEAALEEIASRPDGWREPEGWPTPKDVDRVIEDHWIMGEGPHPDVNEAIIKLFKDRLVAPQPKEPST